MVYLKPTSMSIGDPPWVIAAKKAATNYQMVNPTVDPFDAANFFSPSTFYYDPNRNKYVNTPQNQIPQQTPISNVGGTGGSTPGHTGGFNVVKPDYKSKYGYSSDQILQGVGYDPKTNTYEQGIYDPDAKTYTNILDEAGKPKRYTSGYRPTIKGGKLLLYGEKEDKYFDLDDKGNPVLGTPIVMSGMTTTPVTNAGTNALPAASGVTNVTTGTNPPENVFDPVAALKSTGITLGSPDGKPALEPNPLEKITDAYKGGDTTVAEPGGKNELHATINKLKQMDLDNLRDQKRLNMAQMIGGTAAEIPFLVAALNGDAPDMIQPPQVAVPNLEYDNDIYEQQRRDNQASLASLKNYLSQHGRPELATGALADYYDTSNQMNAQEAINRREFLNQNAIQVADATTKQNIMNYDAQKEYATTIDAMNQNRAQVSSAIMSEMLKNIFGGARANIGVNAMEGKTEGIYEMLKYYADAGDEASFMRLMSILNTGVDLYGGEEMEGSTNYIKASGGQ